MQTPCRVAGYIISVRRTYSCTRALTYLHSWLGRIAGNISETLEDRAKDTIAAYNYKVVHWLSIATKMYDLE